VHHKKFTVVLTSRWLHVTLTPFGYALFKKDQCRRTTDKTTLRSKATDP
jgi:hypothetical protein